MSAVESGGLLGGETTGDRGEMIGVPTTGDAPPPSLPLSLPACLSSHSYVTVLRAACCVLRAACCVLRARRDERSRGVGGSSEMTELLTEIERFEGIVFLATNRPADIDEAMHRRLTGVFELAAPNHKQRALIWTKLTAPAAVPLAEDVDLEAIALKYELTGGFIRNAVLSALLRAVGRTPDAPLVTQADLHEGCREQMRGALQLADIDVTVRGRGPSARPLEALVLPTSLRSALHTLLALEKARPVLQSEWGFDEAYAQRGGVTALFWGPPHAGKRTAAEALAFELGKPVRIVHYASLLGHAQALRRSGGSASVGAPIATLFKEGRLADALLLITGMDPSANGTGADERALQLLLHEMERYPGVVLLCVDAAEPLDAVVHAVHPGLLAAMKAVIPFRLPDAKARAQLWKALVPPACPTHGALDYEALARESEGFGAARIQSCLYRAAGFAAMAQIAPESLTSGVDHEPPRKHLETAAEAAAPALHPGARPATTAPCLHMAELLLVVKEERAKERGVRDTMQRSMIM